MASTFFVDTVTHVPAAWANDVNALVYNVFGGSTNLADARTAFGLGTLGLQNANSVAITGGAIDGTAIGGTVPSSAKFTTGELATVGALPTSLVNRGYVDTNLATITSGLGTMASQNANSVAITGGGINGTVIGGVTPAAGTFTTLRTANPPTVGNDVTNKTYVDAQIAALPVFGTMATQNANNVNITGGTINGVPIGGTTPAAGTFTSVTAPTMTGPNGVIELNGTSQPTYGVYFEASVAKPSAGFQLESGGSLLVLNQTSAKIFEVREASGNTIIGTITDNNVDRLQVNGSVTATMVKLSDPITLANQAATKNYVDTQIGTVPGLISSAITAFSATLGTMAFQNASNVNITGGTLDNVVIGGTTPNVATFTNVTLNKLINATFANVNLDGTGSMIPGTAIMIKATSTLVPNVTVEPASGGSFYVKGGVIPAMQVKDAGRTLINLASDDGTSALQVGGDIAVGNIIRFNGPTPAGSTTPTLGTAGPMGTTTPVWISVKVGSADAVIPAWLI